MFSRVGFVPWITALPKATIASSKFSIRFVLRFHGFLVLRHRRGFVVAGRPMGGGGKPEGEGGDDKKNARICEWEYSPESLRSVWSPDYTALR